MLNFLRPAFARLFNPIVQGLARTPVTPNMITVAGTVGVSAAALWLLPIGELFPGAFIATCLRLHRHARRPAGQDQGQLGQVRRVPRLDDGPVRRRGRLRRHHDLVHAHQPPARRGQPVLPGRRALRLLRQGPGRGPRPERQRRLDRAPGTADHRPDLDRPVRPGHPVRAADRHVGAGRGHRAHPRAADARRLRGRQVPGRAQPAARRSPGRPQPRPARSPPTAAAHRASRRPPQRHRRTAHQRHRHRTPRTSRTDRGPARAPPRPAAAPTEEE